MCFYVLLLCASAITTHLECGICATLVGGHPIREVFVILCHPFLEVEVYSFPVRLVVLSVDFVPADVSYLLVHWRGVFQPEFEIGIVVKATAIRLRPCLVLD